MSSIQWFNIDFLKQNLKKSKGTIIFISLLLPVFTLLSIFLFNELDLVVEFNQLGAFNYIFMYIIPVVLSITLFSFVFKKNSCDFIGSMPLSKKTIFITNTIGGICILLAMQLITALFSFVFSKLVIDSVLFTSVIWDVFVFFSISYIFVFAVSNLAISFSGNMFSTIASILLILFLIPFTLTYSRVNHSIQSNYFETRFEVDEDKITYFDKFNFTGPSLIVGELVDGDGLIYNSTSMVKMMVLSILYFGVGLYLFNRKKYEMAEESFENNTIHYVIKFLTLTPFIAIYCGGQLYESPIASLFFGAILAVYFYVFDLITNKKQTWKLTIITYFSFILIMTAIFSFIVPHLNIINKRSFKISDVQAVTIDGIYDGNTPFNSFSYVVSDSEIIEKLFSDRNNYSYDSVAYSNIVANLVIKLNNGKVINIKSPIGNVIPSIIKKYGNEKVSFSDSETTVLLDGIKLSKEEKTSILSALENDLKDITIKDYLTKISENRENYYLIKAGYKNHRIIKTDYSYGGFANSSKIVIDILNHNAYSKASKVWNYYLGKYDDLREFALKANPKATFSDSQFEDNTGDEDYNSMIVDEKLNELSDSSIMIEIDREYNYESSIDGVINDAISAININDMKEYLRIHKDDNFSKEKPYIIINGYSNFGVLVFYTNDIEGLYKLIAKAYNESGYSERSKIVLNENV